MSFGEQPRITESPISTLDVLSSGVFSNRGLDHMISNNVDDLL